MTIWCIQIATFHRSRLDNGVEQDQINFCVRPTNRGKQYNIIYNLIISGLIRLWFIVKHQIELVNLGVFVKNILFVSFQNSGMSYWLKYLYSAHI